MSEVLYPSSTIKRFQVRHDMVFSVANGDIKESSSDTSAVYKKITIEQQDGQTITVKCNNVSHSSTFYAAVGSKITCSIKPDDWTKHYPGDLNITSATVSKAITVNATAPKNIFWYGELTIGSGKTKGSQGYGWDAWTGWYGSCSQSNNWLDGLSWYSGKVVFWFRNAAGRSENPVYWAITNTDYSDVISYGGPLYRSDDATETNATKATTVGTYFKTHQGQKVYAALYK